jgi:phosphoribosylformylglycinamidine cyclo-ligase
LEQVIQGIATGCQQAGCALLGGETAEMPGFYPPGEYDLAGFCVGIAERSRLMDGSQVRVGDVLVGLASSGLHSNGFSLVRKLVADLDLFSQPAAFGGLTLGETLLTPTRIYVKPILRALAQGLPLHGLAHITGGGLVENLPRALGGLTGQVQRGSWTAPPIFAWLQEQGQLSQTVMDETFNQGLGMVAVVPQSSVDNLLTLLSGYQIPAWPIGEVIEGFGGLSWLG